MVYMALKQQEKRRILLTVSYDGTAYHGFAALKNSDLTTLTIEGQLNLAIEALTGEKTSVIGASRTDAGVHAYGNLAAFDTTSSIPAQSFAPALNTKLPQDIRVLLSEPVETDFHPRKTGWHKTYEYRILNTPLADPISRLYTYPYRAPLQVKAMREAALFFAGTHDFASFCASGSQARTTIRHIDFVEVLTQAPSYPSLVTIRVRGEGFLYHMVRILAGTLLDVGRGKLQATAVPDIIASCDRRLAGATLPPQGLFLMGYDRSL